MSNLFSSFSPAAIGGFSLNWLALSIPILIFPSYYWAPNPANTTMVTLLIKSVHSELSSIVRGSAVPAISLLPISLFSTIALMNSAGLLPYTFTPSSHLSITLAFALPLWLGHMAYSTLVSPLMFTAHLIPQGTPSVLIPFMVLIELTSNLIRPITLSIRLAANMVAGHLLMTLLSNQGTPSLAWMFIVTLSLAVLCTLETAVAFIQGYVLSVLSLLYLEDVNSSFL